MKNIKNILLFSAVAFTAFSCESFLDINENPNQATEATAQQILPNALTNTAAMVVTFNEYGGWHVGMLANGGGYGGWGAQLTYNYTTNDYNGPWNAAYDNISDYRYIEQTTNKVAEQAYYNAIAKIMTAFNYQMLVDAYGNVPYSESIKGTANLTPEYDKAEDIYKDLIVNKLDSATYLINNSPNANRIKPGTGDVMFDEDMARWEKLANTIKLRMLIRVAETPALSGFAAEEFGTMAGAQFLEQDAIVNPGYITSAGKQNPFWNLYHSTAAGARAGAGQSRVPGDYALNLYNGTIIDDYYRGVVTYQKFPSTASNSLGVEGQDVPTSPTGSAWYVAKTGGIGLLKSSTMGQPIMLAAESYLLQAEAYLKGYLAGEAEVAYNKGIVSSFKYLYNDANGNLATYKMNVKDPDTGEIVEETFTYNPSEDAAEYLSDNAENPLVDWNAAATNAQKLEAIITQKYVALNFIHAHEAWNEFRRTGYPSVSASSTFASVKSASPRADKLPVRILYPSSEYQVNPENAPAGVNPFTSLIFWDKE